MEVVERWNQQLFASQKELESLAKFPSENSNPVLRTFDASADKLQKIPVIMLTTSDDQLQAGLCYELGCDAHVIKPVGDVPIKTIQRAGQRL